MHKIEGLKGCGILGFKENINLGNHLVGSSQQLGINPGTIDLAKMTMALQALEAQEQAQAQAPVVKKEDIMAAYLNGQMTVEQMSMALQALEAQQQQAPVQQPANQVTGAVNNLVGTTTNAVGQLAVGSVNAVGDLINAFIGLGANTVNAVTGAVSSANGVNLKEKAIDVVDGTLDNAFIATSCVIDTGVQVGSQAIQVGTQVGTTAVNTCATVANELIKATGEIANTLLGGLGTAAHTVNTNVYVGSKQIIGRDISVKPISADRMAQIRQQLHD